MLILTIFFILYYLSSILKINPLTNIAEKLGENIIKLAEIRCSLDYENNFLKTMEMEELTKKVAKTAIYIIVISLLIIALTIIYFFKAYHLDIYKYPTIILIIFFILQSLKSKKDNVSTDLKTNEEIEVYKNQIKNLNKFNFKYMLPLLIYLTYYLYMLYVLISIKGL